MTADEGGFARQAVALLIERRAQELADIAQHVSQDIRAKELIKRGLINIIKGGQSFEDMQTREGAMCLITSFGLSKDMDVHDELCESFFAVFDESTLAELALLEGFPKDRCCTAAFWKMLFLKNFLRALLKIKDERCVIIVKRVADIFVDTKFGSELTKKLTD